MSCWNNVVSVEAAWVRHSGDLCCCRLQAPASAGSEEDPDLENEELVVREPEDDDGECRARQRSEEDDDAADEAFSFKYSPGKLRGDQYKSMMTKEELEEEQRIELTSDLTSL
nr:PREDICTED: matrix-remodeling-associated protein 7 [Opisthocomus hoazin]